MEDHGFMCTLGTGSVLIPWGICAAWHGDVKMAE